MPSPIATVVSTPTPTASPRETPAPAHVVIDRFLEFGLEEEPFHLRAQVLFEGVVAGEVDHASIEMEGDALGEDFVGDIQISAPGLTMEYELVVVDGTAFVRPPGGIWRETEVVDQPQPLNPFSGLDATDVTYQGHVVRSGRVLHRLSMMEWTGRTPRELGLRRARINVVLFEALVDNQGRPVELELDFNVNGRLYGDPFHFDYDTRYEFSDIDEPVNIEPPI